MFKAQHRAKFWNRERIILGLMRFYNDKGFAPTSTEKYNEHASFTGVDPSTGRRSNLGMHQRYPSCNSVLRYFSTFRQAWDACGIDIDRANESWSTIEDWFLIESAGILPREEVAATLRRSVAACKRRLYDLGDVRCKNRWGISLSAAAARLGVSGAVLQRYTDRGFIPCYRGFKIIYVNPADLLTVFEVDWSKFEERDPAFAAHIRRCLVQRACKIIKHGKRWREFEIYRVHKRVTQKCGRPSTSHLHPPTPRVDDLEKDCWVRIKSKSKVLGAAVGRVGRVMTIHWSSDERPRKDGSRRRCWVARVDFPKLRHAEARYQSKDRVRYTLPIDCLERVDPPAITIEKSMEPKAVAHRERNHKREREGRERFEQIRSELT